MLLNADHDIFLVHTVLVQGWENDTALIIACQNGHSVIANELLKHGAAVDYQNKVMNTNASTSILILMVKHHNCGIINLIINNKER